MNSHDKNMIKVVFIIAMMTGLIGVVSYDYMDYQEKLKGEYQVFAELLEQKQIELDMKNEQCVIDKIKKDVKEGIMYVNFSMGPFHSIYLIQNIGVQGIFFIDGYGCDVDMLPSVSFEEWKVLTHSSYWGHLKNLKLLGGD